MACNCKAKEVVDAALEMSGENAIKAPKNIFAKIASFIMRLALSILVSVVFIILAIPLILYVAVCIILGRQPTVNVGKFQKWGTKLNGGE